MKKRLPLLIIASILVLSMLSLTVVYGGNNIAEIFLNQVNIQVNGESVNVPNLLYNNKTYVSIREICNELGLEIKWDPATNTAKLIGSTSSKPTSQLTLLNTLMYIFSKTFLIAGLILLAQVVFSRTKKDFYFIKKFSSSNTSLKRVIYTSCITRISFYYIMIGALIGFKSIVQTPPLWAKLVFIPVLVLVFWFLGLSLANSISRREQTEALTEE